MARSGFEQEIAKLLRGARKVVVLAVGDELDPRDCLGYLVGRRLSSLKLRKVEVLIVSQMPENYTSEVRRFKPSHVLIIDAADMGGNPGDVAVIDPEKVSATRVSTHAMPLTVLMEYMGKEFGIKVALVGIQPGTFEEMSEGVQPSAVMDGIDRIAAAFESAVS